ncbi:hypothetical protein STXM2123_5869 [Streptomyces sp. F-3]|nr:hypothetical protein STXM2123_5869 [Streptomyces sp. F-3]
MGAGCHGTQPTRGAPQATTRPYRTRPTGYRWCVLPGERPGRRVGRTSAGIPLGRAVRQ